MESRPRLNIQRTPLQNWINIISVFIMGGTAIYLLVNYAKLLDQIPMHFNYLGEVDYWGPKESIFILLGVSILIYILNTRTQHIPHKFNYIVEITEENAEKQYQMAVRMMSIMNLEIMLLTSYISWVIVENIQLNSYVMILFLIILFSTLIMYLVNSRKYR
ncbi:DUF1648 domain-containing protein [Gottfriedia solisilvae]|uniref:DUF1648 domain-containing protein n=1 Tax=Gottfriedia solisilvae TaxID=1516104 RepID=UPI0013022627|nr:DUF1648 domain-containing protein [Gottfriedia solisilvae]